MAKPSIFIGYSNEGLVTGQLLGRLLEDNTDVKAWVQPAFALGQETSDTLPIDPDRFDFAVFILVGDDLAPEIHPRAQVARDNVIFEIGLLAGRLGKSRTFIVTDSYRHVRLPSYAAELTVIPFSAKRAEINLAAELEPVAASIGATIQKSGSLTERPVADYYACFISYTVQDRSFAEQLYLDLQEVGIRAWLDPEEIPAGIDWWGQIDQALSEHDKLLAILSASSINSLWFQHEVEHVLRLERERNRTILFPIRIDDTVLQASTRISKLLLRKEIGDFRHWQDSESYKRAFSRLVKDLTITTAAESKATP